MDWGWSTAVPVLPKPVVVYHLQSIIIPSLIAYISAAVATYLHQTRCFFQKIFTLNDDDMPIPMTVISIVISIAMDDDDDDDDGDKNFDGWLWW